jgi:imidazolonepropionase-like amidohydrolase
MNGRRLLALSLILALAGCTGSAESVVGEGLVALEHATVVDGTGAQPQSDAVVVLSGERILKVGRTGQYRYPDATVVDLTGRWLVPGFMDLHAHMDSEGHQLSAENEARRAATLLAFGVTTIRSPGGAPQVGLRDRIAAGKVLGPRMFTASRLIDMPGGMWTDSPAGVALRTVEEVRAEVRRQAAGGADYVKFYTQINQELLRAGIEEAHAAGVRVIGHLGATSWTDAARLGIDALTHSGVAGASWQFLPRDEQPRFREFFFPGPRFDPALFEPWRKAVSLDGPDMEVLISALVEHRVEVNPTLVITEALYWGDDAALREALEPDFATPKEAAAWRKERFFYSSNWPVSAMAEAKKTFPVVLEIVRRFHQRGVLLTTGTDLAAPWITPGVSVHHEMELFARAGIPPLDVLTIATANGAKALRILDTVGTIEAGKRADLVVLAADPVRDIRNTRKICDVFVAGRQFAPNQLLER